MKPNRINKLAILLNIAAQLPPEEQHRTTQYAHAKYTGALHARQAFHLKRTTFPAHWL